ncbi:MAG: hypothetical protein Ta2D_01840 [Rickettsiales bacterium]|nr:MAG: hypothetical protein Ta2D_01840 [Rickettsiales bacterium]
MYEIKVLEEYNKLFNKMDTTKQVAINKRLFRIEKDGNLGDYKIIDKDLFEFRIFSNGGIRIYFTIQNNKNILLLLNLGFKQSKTEQQKDINKAKALLNKVKEVEK